ncbi:hypothetical protein FLONG3_4852 [Fusarium longipes]|uniref:Uncharacterized protein n=1 Tax=Fusarium longipes TaxID=694270 RepID=A0A395SX20_9HYPO|nr:hypothetical protein FLONG3_4852 [Fusarium longipes]
MKDNAAASGQDHCGEERPTCLQCQRGGRACPGYAREMKFVDEGPKIKNRHRTKNRRLADSTRERATTKKAVPKQLEREKQDHIAEVNLMLVRPGTMKAQRDQIVYSFVSALFPLGSSDVQTSFFGSWLWHLPPRLGNSTVLDHAALSVAWAYFARMFGDKTALQNAEISYAYAVKNLALAISDPNQQLTSNVLCATLLLGHYETFVNVSYAWIRHAGGAARLMQLRGAECCYSSAFEYSMFLTCRGAIIAEALNSRKPCVLEAESWQKIPDGLIEFPLLPRSPHMYHEIFSYFAAIPGLESRVQQCKENTRLPLLRIARKLQQDMQQWYQKFTSLDGGSRKPQIVSPVSKSCPVHSRYEYRDILSASILTTYYAYMILLGQILYTLNPDDTEIQRSFDLAISICMSIDYCLHAGYCGTQTMRFSLPIAHSALPSQYHQWTNAWMGRFSALMEATMIQPLYS